MRGNQGLRQRFVQQALTTWKKSLRFGSTDTYDGISFRPSIRQGRLVRLFRDRKACEQGHTRSGSLRSHRISIPFFVNQDQPVAAAHVQIAATEPVAVSDADAAVLDDGIGAKGGVSAGVGVGIGTASREFGLPVIKESQRASGQSVQFLGRQGDVSGFGGPFGGKGGASTQQGEDQKARHKGSLDRTALQQA